MHVKLRPSGSQWLTARTSNSPACVLSRRGGRVILCALTRRAPSRSDRVQARSSCAMHPQAAFTLAPPHRHGASAIATNASTNCPPPGAPNPANVPRRRLRTADPIVALVLRSRVLGLPDTGNCAPGWPYSPWNFGQKSRQIGRHFRLVVFNLASYAGPGAYLVRKLRTQTLTPKT